MTWLHMEFVLIFYRPKPGKLGRKAAERLLTLTSLAQGKFLIWGIRTYEKQCKQIAIDAHFLYLSKKSTLTLLSPTFHLITLQDYRTTHFCLSQNWVTVFVINFIRIPNVVLNRQVCIQYWIAWDDVEDKILEYEENWQR